MRTTGRDCRSQSVRAGLGGVGLLVLGTIVLCPTLDLTAAPSLPPIVYVSRQLLPAVDRSTRQSAVQRAESGSLVLRTAQGSTVTLVDGSMPNAPVDVIDPDVSFDAKRIVFAGFVAGDSAWRIFEVNADGTGLRRITHSDRQLDLSRYGAAQKLLESYDDVDPCYLPDGRICFVSTRYPGIAPDNRLRTTNLYLVNTDGSDLHRITTERFAADTPTVQPSTGRIVYSRWWRTAQAVEGSTGSVPEPIPPGSPGYGNGGDPSGGGMSKQILRGVDPSQFPGVNSWFLASITPDGTGLTMHSGLRLDRQQTQAYKPSFLPDGSAIALFIPQTPFLGAPGQNGLRRFVQGPSVPTALGGPQTFGGSDGKELPPDVAADGNVRDPAGQAIGPVYASGAAIDANRMLVSMAQSGTDYDIYVQSLDGSEGLMPLTRSAGISEIDAVPLVARTVPPVIADGKLARMSDDVPATLQDARAQSGTFQFVCENIFANAPLDFAIANAPPVGKKLAIEFYMAPQRTGVASADPPILVKSVDIGPDGRVEAELPAGVPLFELLRRPDDSIAQGRDGQIFHVGGMNFGEANQKARCVGCHAGHSMMEVPQDSTWINLAPSAMVDDHSSAATLPGGFPAAGPDGKPVDDRGLFKTAAETLIDRHSDPFSGEWITGQIQDVYTVDFRWGVLVQAREVVVYGPRPRDPNMNGAQMPTVSAFTLTTRLGEVIQQEVSVQENAIASGVHVALSEEARFDRLTLTIQRKDIADNGQSLFVGPALAEVEVMGKVASDGAPLVHFVRGDSDCSSLLNISDAVATLGGLFLGTGFCCNMAADANDDNEVNVTDVVFTLSHLFRGGAPPPAPHPDCGARAEVKLLCANEVCF